VGYAEIVPLFSAWTVNIGGDWLITSPSLRWSVISGGSSSCRSYTSGRIRTAYSGDFHPYGALEVTKKKVPVLN
jgi:hypothetical protein